MRRAIFGGGPGFDFVPFVPLEQVDVEALFSSFKDPLGQLRYVLEARFWEGKTYDTIARYYPRTDGMSGVTRERVRQVQAKALRMLRHRTRIHFWINGR